MEDESGVTRSMMDALQSSNIQAVQMASESCVTRIIIDEIHS